MIDYYIPTRILFGCGSLEKLSAENLPGKRALIVTSGGTSVKKYGYLDRLCEILGKAGVSYAIFDKILPNPVLTHVMEGAALAKAEKCDFIIGLGGGSTIDSSKSIAVMATNPGDYWDYISGGSGKGMIAPNDPLPIVAVTTTAGTGSEADPWSVITKPDSNEKIGYGTSKTFPVLSVVDPELMKSVPPKLTAYQGFDALFHSTEGFLNNNANTISDLFAEKAIALVGEFLPRAVADGSDLESRGNVAMANTLSGMNESTSSCTSEHSLEHAMSAFHPELPHGAGLIVISLAYYEFFAKSGACDDRLVKMAKLLGRKNAKVPMDFVAALAELQKKCGVDNIRMSDYGIKPDEFRKLAQNARDTMGGLFAGDPAPLSEADCIEIYRKSYK